MRNVKGLYAKEWLPATLNLIELNAAPFSLLGTSFDGRELPDVDLDALCEAIFAHIDGPATLLTAVPQNRG